MLMNGGSGTAQTEASVGTVLTAFAQTLRGRSQRRARRRDPRRAAAAQPRRRRRRRATAANGAGAPRLAAPRARTSTPIERTISFEFDETGISRLALYDAVLRFADRCYVFLTRPDAGRIGVQLKPRGDALDRGPAACWCATSPTRSTRSPAAPSPASAAGSAPQRAAAAARAKRIDLEALLAELDAADPATVGLGFQPERGPGHENLRVLNIRGTGACNSECVFCIEKFNPTHRPMPSADATRQLILDSAGKFDMLFFASGEPTIHPKLFEYVELAKSVGFTCFGMSSHFRTFADPRFTLKILQAGFEYFDIALHAADRESQLDVNPIDDDGESLYEALKGLAVLLRLADALGIRVSVTQKIVISRLNVTQLEPIFRATYDRGVRHFIFQPVRTLGLAPELQAKLAISEDEMLPHLNELLRTHRGARRGGQAVRLLAPEPLRRQPRRVRAEPRQEHLRQGARRDSSAIAADDRGGAADRRPPLGRGDARLPDERFGFAVRRQRPDPRRRACSAGWICTFGCRMGSCGMCCARLLEGRVDQSTQIFLTDEQIARGLRPAVPGAPAVGRRRASVYRRRDRSAVGSRRLPFPPWR